MYRPFSFHLLFSFWPCVVNPFALFSGCCFGCNICAQQFTFFLVDFLFRFLNTHSKLVHFHCLSFHLLCVLIVRHSFFWDVFDNSLLIASSSNFDFLTQLNSLSISFFHCLLFYLESSFFQLPIGMKRRHTKKERLLHFWP